MACMALQGMVWFGLSCDSSMFVPCFNRSDCVSPTPCCHGPSQRGTGRRSGQRITIALVTVTENCALGW